jgi:hypothetical protein
MQTPYTLTRGIIFVILHPSNPPFGPCFEASRICLRGASPFCTHDARFFV